MSMKLWEFNGLERRLDPPAISVLRRSVWGQNFDEPLLAAASMVVHSGRGEGVRYGALPAIRIQFSWLLLVRSLGM